MSLSHHDANIFLNPICIRIVCNQLHLPNEAPPNGAQSGSAHYQSPKFRDTVIYVIYRGKGGGLVTAKS